MNHENIIGLLLILWLCSNCTTENKVNPKQTTNDLPKKEKIVSPPAIGTSYNDSLIDKMVKEQLESLNPVPVDTFHELHSFDANKFPRASLTLLSMDTVNRYLNYNNPVTKPQQNLLKISDYFANLSFSENFKTYIFLDKKGESHYSPAIKLWTISNTTNEKYQLPLAQHYFGGENYEKIIISNFNSQNSFRRKIIEYKGPRNTNGFMDENSEQKISEELYVIQEDGKITLIEN